MKVLGVSFLAILGATGACGQTFQGFPVTPATPTDFERRDVGASLSGSGVLSEPPIPEKVKVTFTAVTPLREWQNARKVKVQGRLIAFEQGDYSESERALTIVRGGKVRLLVEGQNNFSLVALSSLSEADQEYVAGVVLAREKAAAEKSPSEKSPSEKSPEPEG